MQPLEVPVRPTVRTPLPDMICTLDTTPFLDNLRKFLDKSTKRPATIYNQQRHLVSSNLMTFDEWIACFNSIKLYRSSSFFMTFYALSFFFTLTLLRVWLSLCSFVWFFSLLIHLFLSVDFSFFSACLFSGDALDTDMDTAHNKIHQWHWCAGMFINDTAVCCVKLS